MICESITIINFLHSIHSDTGVNNEESSRSPNDDVLANNVEHFGAKGGKSHQFGGPRSDGGGTFNSRDSINSQVIIDFCDQFNHDN